MRLWVPALCLLFGGVSGWYLRDFVVGVERWSDQYQHRLAQNQSNQQSPFVEPSPQGVPDIVLTQNTQDRSEISQQPRLTDRLNQALRQQDFNTVAELISQYPALNTHALAVVRSQLIDLLNRQQIAQSEAFFQQIQYVFSDRASISVLFADGYLAGQYYVQAFKYYLLALDNAVEQEAISEIKAVLQRLAPSLVRLKVIEDTDYSWQDLEQYYNRLLQHDPGFISYYIDYAEVLYQLGDLSQASYYLQFAANEPKYAERYSELRQRIDLAQLGGRQVALKRSGSHFLTQGRLNQQVETIFLIDTGASITTISPQKFRQLSQSFPSVEQVTASLRLNTANGAIDVPVYRVMDFEFHGYNLKGVEVAVLPLEDNQADGLLGMNVLGQFEFEINQTDATLRLQPR